MRVLYIVPLFLAVLLSNCSEQPSQEINSAADSSIDSSAANSGDQDARPALDQLSQLEAIARASRVSNVSYDLDIDLVTAADSYQGQVILQFDLNELSSSLEVDFTGGDISQVEVNGEAIEVDYNGFFVRLPATALEQSNVVRISYSHPYDQDGTGLHRFVDPEDGNTYLYTYLWPYYSNRLFPNFDQPNLKATYELKVRAANNWQVISSTMESSVESLGDAKVWHFPQSEKFSSYIFSLHAGPYKIWEDMAGNVPIRLMARQSLAEYVAVDEWMDYTKSGIEHYNNYFEIPYPFKKYDQVIVPDFLIGAMENVAAVTFSESYVDRGSSNRFSSQRRAGTILHEMAHMWF
ncbi:MAG: aminopeptidase N, partial [Pseudohongiellaceae bacterium]